MTIDGDAAVAYLHLAGVGLIPNAIAVNPTLTAAALAARTAGAISSSNSLAGC